MQRVGRIQLLEQRLALSAAPVVSSVELSSSSWDHAFVSYLQANSLGQHGYTIPSGSGQLDALPWKDLDQVTITFDQDVQIDVQDLTLTGVNTSQYEVTGFTYDPRAATATWTLDQPLDEERLLVQLNADGLNPITNLAGTRLDGEWTDTVSVTSGDGIAGGDFEFSVLPNPGDALLDGWVNYFDYWYVYFGMGVTVSDPGYNPHYDIDGSGAVDIADYNAVFAELGDAVPTGTPAGAINTAPTAVALETLSITDHATDYVVDLHALFEDAEDADSLLSYSILSNSASALFDSATIDPVAGELVLSAYGPSSTGRAELVVESTDTGGLTRSTTIVVDVNYGNAPPVINVFLASPYPANTWVVVGSVSDADEDVEGWIVEITGAIETRAVLDDLGEFVFAEIVDPSVYGPITLTVTDSQGSVVTAMEQIGFS